MVWTDIPDFPDYQASSEASIEGAIRSFKRSAHPRILKPNLNPETGYLQVCLRKDGKSYTRTVHKLIARTFIGPRPDGLEVCHYDGNKTNNDLFNLSYDTHASNQQDQLRHGTNYEAARTKCDHGHEFTPENLMWRKSSRNGQRYRSCKTCHNRRMKEWKAKNRLKHQPIVQD